MGTSSSTCCNASPPGTLNPGNYDSSSSNCYYCPPGYSNFGDGCVQTTCLTGNPNFERQNGVYTPSSGGSLPICEVVVKWTCEPSAPFVDANLHSGGEYFECDQYGENYCAVGTLTNGVLDQQSVYCQPVNVPTYSPNNEYEVGAGNAPHPGVMAGTAVKSTKCTGTSVSG